jgi:transcription initiation factor TFIIF subunit beta
MERWSAINAEDVQLATVRVYTPDAPNKKPRIILFLPRNGDPANFNEPDFYEMDMVNDGVENQIVVAERPKDPSLSLSMSAAAATVNTRARTTILTGRIKHECNLRPTFTRNYRHQMRERHKKYNTPVRQIRMIDDAGVPGGRGGVNRLSSGVGVGAGGAFGDLIVSSSVLQFFFFFLI